MCSVPAGSATTLTPTVPCTEASSITGTGQLNSVPAGVFGGARSICFPITTRLQTVAVWAGNITGCGRIVIITSTAAPIQLGASIGCTRYVTVLLTPLVFVYLSVER